MRKRSKRSFRQLCPDSPMEQTFIAIDLKSFYASVECIELGRDPLTTNLVVADKSRTDKTICLAVSPSLKSYGIPGRARLFEVIQKVREVNRSRMWAAPSRRLTGSSDDDTKVKKNPCLALDYITATPRMAHYIRYSTRIYEIYLKYIAPEDMHIYSIDEVFIDATHYLKTYRMTARELAMTMIRDVLRETGITATAGIGTNLYLCKIAMDIVAKHIPADKDGVRIAQLDEMSYRKLLWEHRPLTDFWRVGRGYASRLEAYGIYTMGDIARCSEENEELLYHLFGVNAELLIDHAWGWEPCTMKAIREYRPENNSFSSGQVLPEPYTFEKARVVAREMAEAAALDLLEKRMVTDQVVLTVNYDRESLSAAGQVYQGETAKDYYGRKVPKHAHGTSNLMQYTSSVKMIEEKVAQLFDSTVDPTLLVRRMTIDVNHVIPEKDLPVCGKEPSYEQLDLFTDPTAKKDREEKQQRELERERKANEAMLEIKKRFGKNAMLKGVNYAEGATGRDRNSQIGGHKA